MDVPVEFPLVDAAEQLSVGRHCQCVRSRGHPVSTVFVDWARPLRVAADFDALDGGERDIGGVFAGLVLDEDEGLVIGLRVIHRRLKEKRGRKANLDLVH